MLLAAAAIVDSLPADGDARRGAWRVSRGSTIITAAWLVCAIGAAGLRAHSGPPFPIVKDAIAGAYAISVWTDPDATDDGTAGGRFWITLQPADGKSTLSPETSVTLLVEPIDRSGAQSTAGALALDSDPARRYAAVVLDHEGRFRVRVTVIGPLGPAFVDSDVEATYDQRPPPALIVVYLMPFLLVGFLWAKLMWRRGHSTGTAGTLKSDCPD